MARLKFFVYDSAVGESSSETCKKQMEYLLLLRIENAENRLAGAAANVAYDCRADR